MAIHIPERPAGKIPTTAVTNELARAINSNGGKSGPKAQVPPWPNNPKIGIIVETGPGAAVNFTDERYWVKRAYLTAPNGTGSQVVPALFDEASGSFEIVEVTNLLEVVDHSHALSTNTPILFWVFPCDSVDTPKKYVTLGGGGGAGALGIWIKITSSTLIPGMYNRWRYGWTEQEVVRAGAYQDKPGGLSGGNAYNTVEANNDNAGVQGNSINLATLPAGMTIQPVRGGPVVRAWYITNCDDGQELHFSYENAVDGECA